MGQLRVLGFRSPMSPAESVNRRSLLSASRTARAKKTKSAVVDAGCTPLPTVNRQNFLSARTSGKAGQRHLIRNSGRYPLRGRRKTDLYTVFAELMRGLVNDRGRVGCVVPTGIATDDTTKFFFQDVVMHGGSLPARLGHTKAPHQTSATRCSCWYWEETTRDRNRVAFRRTSSRVPSGDSAPRLR